MIDFNNLKVKKQFVFFFHVYIFCVAVSKEFFFFAHSYVPTTNVLDMKKITSNGEAPVLELLGIRSSSSLLLLTGPLWPRVVAPDRVLSMGQIELFEKVSNSSILSYREKTNDLC